jgi:hypothetical protein
MLESSDPLAPLSALERHLAQYQKLLALDYVELLARSGRPSTPELQALVARLAFVSATRAANIDTINSLLGLIR